MATVYLQKDGVTFNAIQPSNAKRDPKKQHANGEHFYIRDDSTSSCEGSFIDGKFERQHGLNWFITGLFVVGDLAGGGLVALPTAITQSGFVVGIITLAIMTCIFTYTAYILGQCWNILQRRWPDYRTHCRKPYAEISYRAIGPFFKTIVSACINITQFGVTVVFLALAAKNFSDLIKTFFDVNFSLCYIIVILAGVLFPVLLLKSPEEFWWAGIIAMCTTSCAVVLICIGSIRDYSICNNEFDGKQHQPDFKITNYFIAIGTYLFAYGGHPVFPTVQHDMKKPHQFTFSAIQAYTILSFMYFPASILGSLTYGDSLRDSVINSLQTTWIQTAVNIFITLHVVFTIIIMSNPMFQEVEEKFGVSHDFGIQRIAARGLVLLAAVFMALTVPNFGPMLNLVGASTMTLTSCFFPALFYLYLTAKENKADDTSLSPKKNRIDELPSFYEVYKYNSKITFVLCIGVLVFGLIGGGGATFSAIRELTRGDTFVTPCYVRPFVHGTKESHGAAHTNCCGFNQTLSRYPGNPAFCNDPLDIFDQGKHFVVSM